MRAPAMQRPAGSQCRAVARCSRVSRAVALPLVCRAALKPPSSSEGNAAEPLAGLKAAAKRLGAVALGTGAALSLVLSPALAEPEILRLPASDDPVVFAAQRTLVEAWTIVAHSFVDTDFNGHSWEEELKEHMMAAYNSADGDKAFAEIGAMLEDLGDPYTRRIPPEEYASFRVSSDGELQGVGMLIANEPVNGRLLVLAPIKGGPADRAGILPGDELTSINGMSLEGWNGEKAARMLRGTGGTEVRVKLARRSGGIPGVASRPDPPLADSIEFKEVSLRRERVQLSPLYHAALPAAAADAGAAAGSGVVLAGGGSGGGAVSSASAGTVGYLRLTSFSSNAAQEMREAIRELESRGASSYILDLRNNPGGLVRASVDIARLWLDGAPVVFNVTGREGDDVQPQRVDAPGTAATHRPLAVLVNAMSASASEILSGALHDNHRATIIGDSNTYGKGKIQSVFELQDGSALFVTVARYQTPAGTEIDRVGVHPDASCALPGGGPAAADVGDTFVAGLPMVPGTEAALLDLLMADKCIVAARQLLQREAAEVAAPPAVAQQQTQRGWLGMALPRPFATLQAPPLQ
ncbi:hypothetical protein HYH03_010665 [Edaphochlamys debaryana]|uniref:PDZ domain-containing protein n=1 Tax=Edaphochlamys debaryana TaxID=47281 RepID=A0A836BX98_9CHLO|nr:hypothetical protein HYH03_010665 [Edaphochlamys debaryana]|eukprot:KAG2490993.1 hypothetical protein HYH03_010665 [Edaphochlamys debaryana]